MTEPSLAGLNERNRDFWAQRLAIADQQMSDEGMRTTAFRILATEHWSGISVEKQSSLYVALDRAEGEIKALEQRVRSASAAKAGSARTGDALQVRIEQLVGSRPEISE